MRPFPLPAAAATAGLAVPIGPFDLTDHTPGRSGCRVEKQRKRPLANSGDRVFSPHFPYPGTGHVVRAGDGFASQPGMA